MSEVDPEFYAHIADLEDEYGVELSDEAIAAIHEASTADGFTEEATEAAFAEIASEADQDQWDSDEPVYEPDPDDGFEEDTQRDWARIQGKLGRQLTQREVAAISDGLAEQHQRGQDISAEAALKDYHEQGGKQLDVVGHDHADGR